MDVEELKAYHGLILDAWQGLKKYLPAVTDDPDLWEEIINHFAALSEKYKGGAAEQFAIVFCCDCLRELERVNNDRRREAKGTQGTR